MLSPGGDIKSLFVLLLHVVTWLIAVILIFAWANPELAAIMPPVSPYAKTLGGVYGGVIFGIIVVVLLHSARATRSSGILEQIVAVILVTLVLLELSLGCAYVAVSATLASEAFYSAAMLSHIFVCAGCAMVLTFYINFKAPPKSDGFSSM